jgi:hypothetical protein
MNESDGSKYEAPYARRLGDSPLGRGDDCMTAGSHAISSCHPNGSGASDCSNVGNSATSTCWSSGQSAYACNVHGNSPSSTCTTNGSGYNT